VAGDGDQGAGRGPHRPGVVVGAGAVVTEDLPDGAVAVGIPARVVRHREGGPPRG
jgi:serine acetyltransferase